MSLESFYGGKQGISPVIKASFEYIDANDSAYQAALANGKTVEELLPLTMDLCFANTNYKDVWYDELCLIDTTNKNNPNNGKLFRRTLKSAGDTGINLCAEYLGRIIGPAGTNPFFSFGNLTSVNEQGKIENIDLADEMQVSYPIDENGTTSSAKTEIIEGVETQFNIEPTIQTASLNNNILVPGKDGNVYHDEIRYTWLNVLDDRNTIPTRSIVYMGFEIPYPSLEIYSTTTNWWNSVNITKRETEHIFYHAWDLTVPRGIRGNAATNVRLTQQKEFSNISGGTTGKPILYDFENDLIDNGVGVYTLRTLVDANDHYGPDLPNREGIGESYIWVYDYVFYDVDAYDNNTTSEQVELTKTYTFYLGSYNEISDVTLDEDGTLTFHYSNATENVFDQQLVWINNISVSDSGVITFTYNQDKYYTITADTTPNTNKNYYIYSNNQYIAQPNITQFTPGVVYYEGSKIYSKQMPYPTSVIVNDNGTITLNLADSTELILKDSTGSTNYKLDYVKAVDMNADTKVLYTTTTVNNTTKNLNGNKGINYIETITIDEKYHLLIYYASTQYRITLTDISNGWKYRPGITSGTSNRLPITVNGNYATWDGKTFRKGITGYDNIYWQDFGSVRELVAGVKVRTEVNYTNHPQKTSIDIGNWTPENFITTVLNPQYWGTGTATPNPYYEGNIPGTDEEGRSLRGTFVYVPTVNNGSLFFYDYDAENWVYAGSLSDSSQTDAQIELNDGTALNAQVLANFGIALIEKTEVNSTTSLLPDFGV